MCRSETSCSVAAPHWLRSSNRQAVVGLMSRLEGSGLLPEQVAGWASANGVGPGRAMDLLVDTPRLLATLDTSAVPADGAAAVLRLRHPAAAHATISRAISEAVVLLPQGVSRLPPHRPPDYNLAGVPPERLAGAINALETNSNPVSSPAYRYPADPLFATWFNAQELLGTRAMTMAELNAVIRTDLAWKSGTSEFRQIDSVRLVADSATGLEAFHELHKFAAGFRGQPALEGRALVFYAGQGGEKGGLARMTDPAPLNSLGENIGVRDEARIRGFFEQDLEALRNFPINQNHWSAMEQKVTAASNGYVEMIVFAYRSVGSFADPREQAKLKGTLDSLLTSEAETPERARAAQALYRNFEARDQLLRTVSVSGMAAEIQMGQVLHRYLKLDQPGARVDVGRPDNTVDVVEVYELYRQMADRGELTTRATVEGWLQDWGVSHVP